MINFEYYTPTRVVFGKDAEKETGKLVKAQGCRKVLLHYGGQSAKKSGLLDRIEASLKEAGIDYISLGGIGHHTADDGILPHQLAAENVPLTLAVLDEPLLCTGKAGVVIVAGPGQDGSILHHVPHGVAGHHRPYHQVPLTVGAGA